MSEEFTLEHCRRWNKDLRAEVGRLKKLCARAADALSTVSMTSEQVQDLITTLRHPSKEIHDGPSR